MFASSPVGCGWGEIIKSWHRHGVWTCSPTSLTSLSTMPWNIWTRYNFCLFLLPSTKCSSWCFCTSFVLKTFLYQRSLMLRQGSLNQSTSSQTWKSGLASPLPSGTCTHSFLPFHLHFFQRSSAHLWTPLPFLLASRKKNKKKRCTWERFSQAPRSCEVKRGNV